jgi:arylsulfatase A-like enzyme
MTKLTRRDFLKLTIAGGTAALSGLMPQNILAGEAPKGIVVIVFDAMSARNLSVYGYPRKTTPNFERFASRATVFHSHNSAGNYTTPGVASLLTGTYPWTHRALNISGLIARKYVRHNIFNAFGDAFHRFAYSQNISATYQLDQFGQDVDVLLPPETFSTISTIVGSHFTRDRGAAFRAFDGFLTTNDELPAALVLGSISRIWTRRELARYQNADYPAGPPRMAGHPLYFELKEVFDGVIASLQQPVTKPLLAYYHLWAPHAPYRPTSNFLDLFLDNWKPLPKPQSSFGFNIPNSKLNTRRQHYDEYIANVDDEFARLLDEMEQNGILENNYVVVTSDHGEMFERGVDGHITPLLYDPVIHIPLMISAPGQMSRVDITTPTNSVDIVPTLLHAANQKIPDWCEGQILPGLGGMDDPARATFTVEAKSNSAFAPLRRATIAMRKGQYKLICYIANGEQNSYELYDHENDIEELDDLYPRQPSIAKAMREELLEKLSKANLKYRY